MTRTNRCAFCGTLTCTNECSGAVRPARSVSQRSVIPMTVPDGSPRVWMVGVDGSASGPMHPTVPWGSAKMPRPCGYVHRSKKHTCETCKAITRETTRLRSWFTAHRPELWAVVVERDGEWCAWCGTDDDLTLDHYMPLAARGPSTPDNLWILCRACNMAKGSIVPAVPRPY